LGERRIRALRDLAAREGQAHSVEESFHLAAEALSDCALDVPFTLFYVLDAKGEGARLTAWTGLAPGGPREPVARRALAGGARRLAPRRGGGLQAAPRGPRPRRALPRARLPPLPRAAQGGVPLADHAPRRGATGGHRGG